MPGVQVQLSISTMPDTDDLYKVLGTASDATSADLKQAYESKAGKVRLDKLCCTAAGSSAASLSTMHVQGSVLEQQQVEGAWDILGKEPTRKQYDKDARERKPKAPVEEPQSTAEVALSGLATADTGHINLEDLKATAAKVRYFCSGSSCSLLN